MTLNWGIVVLLEIVIAIARIKIHKRRCEMNLLNKEYGKKYGLPLVIYCRGCNKVKRFGEFVPTEMTLGQIQERFETIFVLCPNCQEAFHK